MPINNRIAALADEVAEWRRDFHEHPELLYDVHRTAGVVADKLKEFGCDEIVPGVGRTGVVGIIHGNKRASGKVIGLRADMDALPILEDTSVPYASKTAGKMHACGHDGHTAMLLGAAKYLAETRNFDGTAVVIFQPAEEGGAGGKAMVDDGLMTRFKIDEVYGMHNAPGMAVGSFAINDGPMLAAADRFEMTIDGLGGHAAKPHQCVDTIVIGAQIVNALQSIVSRNVDPLESCVISVTKFDAGTAFNILPQTATIWGTVRTLTPAVRDIAETRFRAIVEGVVAMHGARVKLRYERGYPVTSNHAEQARFFGKVAQDVAGATNVDTDMVPLMGGEDFSFMLLERPGAFIFCGNGDTAGLHHPKYDFNDAAIAPGVSLWAKLVETALPA